MFKRFGFLLLFSLLSASLVLAQAAPADYAIRNIRSRFVEAEAAVIVEFEVWNIGSAATIPATAALTDIGTGQQIASQVVRPLAAQEIVTITFSVPVGSFTPDSVQSLRAAVGIDEIEQSGAQTIQNNFAQISISIPAAAEVPDTSVPGDGLTDESAEPSGDPIRDALDALGIQVDMNDPVQVAVLIGIAVAVIILVLIFIVILSLILRRPPDFGNWQPPYSNMLPLDPNSIAGRRQQWQQYAQNNSLAPAPCAEGVIQVRKLLTDMDNLSLSRWRVTAIRLTHYDMYGRINRSQMLVSKGVVRRLDGIVRRRHKLSNEQLLKRLRPVGKGLVNNFRKKFNQQNTMLPIAMDIRLRSKFGEVKIAFELYQCRYGGWQKIDEWQPEITLVGKTMHESYTYTVFGQRPGETPKVFRERLANDLAQVLLEMVTAPVKASTAPPDAPTDPSLKRVTI